MSRDIESFLPEVWKASLVQPSAEDVLAGMLADREAEQVSMVLGEARGGLESAAGEALGEEPGQVSAEAYNLIVAYESGGESHYEKTYRCAACWPGYSSGITIGFGYDLGYYKHDQFWADWSQYLSEVAMRRFEQVLGFRTTEPERAGKVEKAKRLVRQLSDIKIPWGLAETVFAEIILAAQHARTRKHLPQAAALPANCVGALVSLVFNRGASFALEGERYREMRAIAAHLANGDFYRVPDELRAMKRLWNNEGLKQRREDEAALFLKGLNDARPAGSGLRAGEGSLESTRSPDAPEEFDSVAADEAFQQSLRYESVAVRGRSWRDVRWAPDEQQPDYRHLDYGQRGFFTFTAEDLELLVAANAFEPLDLDGAVLFGLRGCALDSGTGATRVPQLSLRDQRPDHRELRCLIGVWHRQEKLLSAFLASTVPNSHFVWKYWSDRSAGNLLPTGCYRYRVGTHRHTPGCFRQGRDATVLRSPNDLSYSIQDKWDCGCFWDNIHPTFGEYEFAKFSSAGCLTVRGTHRNGEHRGEWAEFRNAAGLDQGCEGREVDIVLLTGLEALIASRLRAAGRVNAGDREVMEHLMRLRSGSRGARVALLQKKLGLNPDGEFGALTRQKLALVQSQHAAVSADGIYSPECDRALGFGIFAATPASAPVPAPVPGEAPSASPALPPPAAPAPRPVAAPPPAPPAPAAPLVVRIPAGAAPSSPPPPPSPVPPRPVFTRGPLVPPGVAPLAPSKPPLAPPVPPVTAPASPPAPKAPAFPRPSFEDQYPTGAVPLPDARPNVPPLPQVPPPED